jgi:hypothetical protein
MLHEIIDNGSSILYKPSEKHMSHYFHHLEIANCLYDAPVMINANSDSQLTVNCKQHAALIASYAK